ncbi:adenylyl-sulfate kinase [Azospirillum sp. Vi22]|nr:adenylyl-sulfate kinase [Azospirillum baldaniorum]NUB05037.1 adenylyl-sulfate kinase [Azospirillum baldaniorum]
MPEPECLLVPSEPTFAPPRSAVFWITGLSAAGKTTVGRGLADRLRVLGRPVLYLDGDVLRSIVAGGDRYSRADRLDLAHRYGRLCREAASQGIDVVCATISMFDAVRAWNREHIPGYCEVYLRVPIEELKRRDTKDVYRNTTDVVGLDLAPELPKTPDVLIDNFADMTPARAVQTILESTAIPAGTLGAWPPPST